MSKNLQEQVIDINSDIEDFLESYLLQNLVEEEELCDYIDTLSDIKKEYRKVYTKLKLVEGDFDNKYPNYQKDLDGLNECFKTANGKLSNVRK